MIIGTSFAIALVILVTSTRIWICLFRSRAFGSDDILIIPAAIGTCAHLGLNIATEAAGCLGEHYTIAYFWNLLGFMRYVAKPGGIRNG